MQKVEYRFGIPVSLYWERDTGDVSIKYERVTGDDPMNAAGKFTFTREGVRSEVWDLDGPPYWDLQTEAINRFGTDVVTALCHYTTVPQAAAFNAKWA